ncbi:SDR family oxidoreductase [Bogoriella caseilytica]|uniref:3-oxoacyl-[acyl-carrier protein] reductase n=1 Tax=Bogoriella caseilytica TaxID=56055 RepID=A0A3N2BCP7_9MICO|nr:SDR family oxidoreductase [Bogoriella caseilytica]ROR73008.1 3-oxoacyl-[acyl-carrier protein] reductase [Bogoriella caseilytica]
MHSTPSLQGRTALVTGASRRSGIGYAVAARLASMGASIVLHHHRPHDADQPWGADDLAQVRAGIEALLGPGAAVHDLPADLADPDAPSALLEGAVARAGHLDILVCNHARSGGDATLADMDVEKLDGHWSVNTRATLLLTQAFAAQHDGREGGRAIWMTSGQQQGPMAGEVAYAASKAALAGVTATVASELARRGILLNTVNPGPVNTGYLDPGMGIPDDALADLRQAFPSGRLGEPDDPARLIAWLVSDEGRWMVGQVLNTEGGFRL